MNNSPWPPKHQPISHRRPRLRSSLSLAVLGNVAWPQRQEVEYMQDHLRGGEPGVGRTPKAAGAWGHSWGGRVHGLSGFYRDLCAGAAKGDCPRVPEQRGSCSWPSLLPLWAAFWRLRGRTALLGTFS